MEEQQRSGWRIAGKVVLWISCIGVTLSLVISLYGGYRHGWQWTGLVKKLVELTPHSPRPRRCDVRATHRIVREFREVVQMLSFELVQRPRKLEDKGVGLGRRVILEGRHALDPTIILE